MKLLLEKLASIGVGTRPMTEEDFFANCEANGVEVIWSDKKYSFYFTLLNEHFIVLPKRLRGLKLLFAMWHEYAHFVAHVGNEPQALFNDLADGKDEAEADAAALVAIAPKHMLKDVAFFDGSRYGAHLYNERLRLFFLYDI